MERLSADQRKAQRDTMRGRYGVRFTELEAEEQQQDSAPEGDIDDGQEDDGEPDVWE